MPRQHTIDVHQSEADGSPQHLQQPAMVSPNAGTRLRPTSATRRDRPPSSPTAASAMLTTQAPHQDGSVVDGDELVTPVKANLRQEIELKRAKAKADEEANLTFKPSMYTSHHKSISAVKAPTVSASVEMSPRENRFDKLYSDALKRHLSSTTKEEMMKDKELTFTPKLTSRSGSRSNSRPSSRSKDRPNLNLDTTIIASNANAPPHTPIYERLNTPTRISRRDTSDTNSEFSFTPNISKRAKSIERLGAGEVSRRLYEHSNTAREKIEQKKSEYQQKELEGCTFSPHLVTKRSGSANRGKPTTESSEPLVDRLSKYEDIKRKKLEVARRNKEKEELADVTFKPVLVTSKRPSTPTSRMPVHERLAIPMEKSVSPSVALAYEELTFQPKLIARRVTSPEKDLEAQESVHDRLFKEGVIRKMEQDHERAMKREEQESSLTFKPEINRDYKLSDDRAEGPVFSRLAANPQKVEVKEKIERMQAELTREWTFSPVISDKSKRIVTTKEESPLPIYDRLAEEDRIAREDAERKRREKEQKEEEELKSMSFQPKLPRKSISIAKRSSIIGDSDVYARLLNAHLEGHKLNENIAEGSVSASEPDSKKVLLPEKNIQEICRRLSVTQIGKVDLPPPPEVKKVALPEHDVNTIFTRLQSKRTKSFILKSDSEEAEKFIREHSGVKEGPKLSQSEMDTVLERLRNQTASSGVYTEIGHARRQSVSANSSPMRRESFSTSPMRRESFSNSSSPTPLSRSLSRMNSNGSICSVGSQGSASLSTDFLQQPSSSYAANTTPSSLGIAAIGPQRTFASPPKSLSSMNIFAQVSNDSEEDAHVVEDVAAMTLDPYLSTKSSRSLSIIREADDSDGDEDREHHHHRSYGGLIPESNSFTLQNNTAEISMVTTEEGAADGYKDSFVKNSFDEDDEDPRIATSAPFQVIGAEHVDQPEDASKIEEEEAPSTNNVVSSADSTTLSADEKEEQQLPTSDVVSVLDVTEEEAEVSTLQHSILNQSEVVEAINHQQQAIQGIISHEEVDSTHTLDAQSSESAPVEDTQLAEEAPVAPHAHLQVSDEITQKEQETVVIDDTILVVEESSSVKKLVESFSPKGKSRIPISDLMRKDSKKDLTKRPSFNNGKANSSPPRRSPSPSSKETFTTQQLEITQIEDPANTSQEEVSPLPTQDQEEETQQQQQQEEQLDFPDELNLTENSAVVEEKVISRANSIVINTEPVSLPVTPLPSPPVVVAVQPNKPAVVVEVPQIIIPPTPPTVTSSKSLSRKPSEEFEKKLDEINAMCDPSYFTNRKIVLDPSIKLVGEEVITPKAVIAEPSTSSKNTNTTSNNNTTGNSNKPPKVPTPTSSSATPTSSKNNSFSSPTAAKTNGGKSASNPTGKSTSSEPRSLKGGKKKQTGSDSADESSVNNIEANEE